MKAETVFSIVNLIAIAGWLLLVFLPRFKVTKHAVLKGTIPLLLSVAYLILIVLFFGNADGGFDSLENVMKLFTNEWAVLSGWIHYLAFDLFVGAWEVSDSKKNGVHHLLVVPCLFFTFMLGPIGLLLYFCIRAVVLWRKKDAATD